ncbi:MAG TPA: hypothetical protein VHO69_05405 [Phototrophicaceae bacterium]|nr:hypothetical protein [Phototrophicaceae bacterium]
MMPSHYWARNLNVSDQDVEYLTGLLLEKETPLSTEDLARALIEERLRQEASMLQERYKDVLPYNPAHTYPIGQRLVFSAFNFETGTVINTRTGNNQEYGEFTVIAVEFDDNTLNNTTVPREFATGLTTAHKLSQLEGNGAHFTTHLSNLTADEILDAAHDDIIAKVDEALSASSDLIYLAQKWFPYNLLLDVNIGHRNLAEAVLDMNGGGPLMAEEIVQEIGGLGDAPQALQTYSLNYSLNDDDRFDEVGPTGEILWYLTRLEPPEVRQTPATLRYTPIDYDRTQLTPDMLALEAEIGDELTTMEPVTNIQETTVNLIYPHRRLGTLPLNNRLEAVFPTARQTPRVWVTLVDGQDGEEYPAWVVRKDKYIFGLAKFYRKHKLPVGVAITARKSDEPGKVVIDFNAYRPRTEWIRLIVPHNDVITFENQKRAIGAQYDELMILGADDLAGVDAIAQTIQQQKKSLAALLKLLIPPLGALTPQGTVHAKTLYSAVNIMRRCPPGPILVTLLANPDFENVGGHYWKLRFD